MQPPSGPRFLPLHVHLIVCKLQAYIQEWGVSNRRLQHELLRNPCVPNFISPLGAFFVLLTSCFLTLVAWPLPRCWGLCSPAVSAVCFSQLAVGWYWGHADSFLVGNVNSGTCTVTDWLFWVEIIIQDLTIQQRTKVHSWAWDLCFPFPSSTGRLESTAGLWL